jgi:acetyl-CoA C-acetyltransferase
MGNVILAGARTPIGKLSGALASLRAADLEAIAITEALRRAGVAPDVVQYVTIGQVLQAGARGNAARQAAVQAGIPWGVPASTINKMCLSGLNAIHLADLMISAGEADVVIAGGMDSMSQAPYLLPGARGGFRYGDEQVLDVILEDGLRCAFEHIPMGEATERQAAHTISRERQDHLAALSHERAARAAKSGRLSKEIVAVAVPQRRAEPVLIEHDEGIRPETSVESLASLRPVFVDDGTITAGNASQISDGAAALVIASKSAAERLGVTPLAEILAYGQVAGPDTSLLTQPSRAIRRALERAGRSLADVEVFEINEAFATVSAASMADLGIDESVVNLNGGAIALGHPLGMSGARIALSLAYELAAKKSGIGAAALCGAGGQGDAILLTPVA